MAVAGITATALNPASPHAAIAVLLWSRDQPDPGAPAPTFDARRCGVFGGVAVAPPRRPQATLG